jgi:phenylacetate-coenzyme A ligase PaaK-like adenylate-forming protein
MAVSLTDFKTQFKKNLFSVTGNTFAAAAMELFRFQAKNCSIYREFLSHLNIKPESIQSPEEVPFLPVEMFRHHKIITAPEQPADEVFRSSGTTDIKPSRHYVMDSGHYKAVLRACFRYLVGKPEDFAILALLPSYLERNDASLVYMVQDLMTAGNIDDSGFYLHDYEQLIKHINKLRQSGTHKKILLLGVSFALLDLAEKYPVDLSGVLVMETGGMKGRRRELIREELHHKLCKAFQVETIGSEYGMTELLSQAYALSSGEFSFPPWAGVYVSDPYDPLTLIKDGRSGTLNIIDLANVDSCAFLATRDIGVKNSDGSFQVLGRMDNSDIRGCNLLFEGI